MIAFDTNLAVRALVTDNPEQVAIARRLMAEDTVFLSRTVLLETEWVLRSCYNRPWPHRARESPDVTMRDLTP